MISYAYLHCRPDGSPFYVGKGQLRRTKLLAYRNKHHAHIVNKYGAENILIGKFECSSDDIAFDLEKGLIKCLRRSGVELCNYTDGGEGGLNPREETRQLLSRIRKGRPISPQTQVALIKARKGIPLSEKHKLVLSIARKGMKFTEEHRKNIALAQVNKVQSKESNLKRSATLKGRIFSEETRRRISEAKRNRK